MSFGASRLRFPSRLGASRLDLLNFILLLFFSLGFLACILRSMGVWSDELHSVMKHLLHVQRLSIKQVADELKVDHQTVRYWSKRPAPSQIVRKRKLPDSDSSRILDRQSKIRKLLKVVVEFNRVKYSPVFRKPSYRVITRRPFRTSGRIRRELFRRWGLRVAVNTVRSDLIRLGLRPRRRARGPYLSSRDRDVRVSFCRSELQLRSQLIFSDEKWLLANDGGNGWQWVSPDELPDVRSQSQEAERICLWGIIAPGFRYLRVSFGTVTKAVYKSFLSDALPHVLRLQQTNPFLRWQQDGSRAHLGSLSWLESKGVRVVNNWPPRSCDLNVIENLWSYLQSKVSEEGPWSRDDLVHYVSKVWNEMDMEIVNRLCSSYHRRLEKVIEKKGVTVRP